MGPKASPLQRYVLKVLTALIRKRKPKVMAVALATIGAQPMYFGALRTKERRVNRKVTRIKDRETNPNPSGLEKGDETLTGGGGQ